MGEKVVVVQEGVQKQPKGWGCPVVVGEQEEEEEEEAGEGSELLLKVWWRETAWVGWVGESTSREGFDHWAPRLLLFETQETSS